jgi:glycosyltransferase involved in cell wall biosynthesis
VVYVLLRFPALTETFIAREIWELRQAQDIDIQIYCLLNPKSEPVNTLSEKLLPYVHNASPVYSWRFWWAQLHFLYTRPRVYTSLLRRLLTEPYPAKMLRLCLRRLLIFLKAISLAHLLEDVDMDLIHTHFAGWSGAGAWVIANLLNQPFTVTAGHGYDIYTSSSLVRLITTDAKHVITVAEFNRQVVLKKSPELKEDDTSLIPCSIDLTEFEPTRPKEEHTPTAIIAVGRLVEKKGLQYLVQACQFLEAEGVLFRCTIIGGGTAAAERELKQLIRESGLDERFTLKGARSFSEILEELDHHDIFVLPCVVAQDGDRDARPVVMVEAAAMGLPVISTPVGGIPELVNNGRTGLLVPERDAEHLAEAIKKLILDKELRKEMGRNGRLWVEKEFDIKKNAAKIASIFHEVAAEDRLKREPNS